MDSRSSSTGVTARLARLAQAPVLAARAVHGAWLLGRRRADRRPEWLLDDMGLPPSTGAGRERRSRP